jgi:DivIVA domain-containing protein
VTLTAAEISTQQFRIVFRGYDVQEVDAFLDRLHEDLARREDGPAAAPTAEAPTDPLPPADRGTAPTDEAPAARALRTLQRAEEMADQLVADAAAEAATIVGAARIERETLLAEARERGAREDAELLQRRQREIGALALHREELQAELTRLAGLETGARRALEAWLAEHQRLLGRPVPGDPAVPGATLPFPHAA